MRITRRKEMAILLVLTCLCPIVYVYWNLGEKMLKITTDQHQGNDRRRLTNESSAPEVKRILLVSYGRSGSTFTSYLLNQAPNTFFFFEPLRATLARYNRREAIIMSYERLGGKFWEAREMPVSNLTSYEQNALKLLDHLFNCEIGKFPVNDYISNHFLLHGDVSKVTKCLWNMVNSTYLDMSHYLQCLMDFWHTCHLSKIRLFKVIRLPIRVLFSLMRKYTDLHVVYLVRDPRAILFSQKSLFGSAPLPENFCRMMADDAAHMKLLQDTFPLRALAVRYEDIVKQPLNYTRQLYQALGLPFSSNVEMNVRRLTSGKGPNVDQEKFSPVRSDPQKAASTWREEISFDLVHRKDTACQAAYDWFGYIPAANVSVLRNRSVPLTRQTCGLPFL